MNSASDNQQSFYPSNPLLNRSQDPSTSFLPTAVQKQRVNDLKRFNRLMVYLPLGLITAALLGLLVYLLIIAIWPPYEDTRLFLSGIADIILILFFLPVALILGLLLVGILGGAIYWQRSRPEEYKTSMQGKYGRVRVLLWKVDQKLSTLYRQIDKFLPKLVNPVIRFNVFTAYLTTWLNQLRKQLNRHNAE